MPLRFCAACRWRCRKAIWSLSAATSGISRSAGALMLSVLLGTAFLSRQIWGAISDRIGGLATVLIGSAWQSASMTAFLLTQ